MFDFVEAVDSCQSLAPIKKKLVCNSEKKITSQKIDIFVFKLYLYTIQNTLAQKIFDICNDKSLILFYRLSWEAVKIGNFPI